jgi:hypothetical protein
MDIAGMVDNLALSGVFPGSSGIPATELAALDAADVCRAKNLFTDGASYPASTPYHGTYLAPRNIDLTKAIAVVDALYRHEKARFECKPGVYLEVAEAYGYYLADYFNHKLPPAQRAFEIGKRAIKQASAAAARARQAAKAARKGKPQELRDGLAATAREVVLSQVYEAASLFGAPRLPPLDCEADAEGKMRLQPAAGFAVTTPVTDGATPHHAPVDGLEDMDATTLRFGEGVDSSEAQDDAEREWVPIEQRASVVEARAAAAEARARATEAEATAAEAKAEREKSTAERELAEQKLAETRAAHAAEGWDDRAFPEMLMGEYGELQAKYQELLIKMKHMAPRNHSHEAYEMGVRTGREEALEEMEACGLVDEVILKVGARLEGRKVVSYADVLSEYADECSSECSSNGSDL